MGMASALAATTAGPLLSLSAITKRFGSRVLFAGFMASLSGAFLSIGDIHTFTEGMTRRAGYLAVASVIFGKWRKGGTVIACLLFGAATAFAIPASSARHRRSQCVAGRTITAADGDLGKTSVAKQVLMTAFFDFASPYSSNAFDSILRHS